MKLRKLLILSIVLLLLSGCAKKSSLAAEYGYKYYESNGKHYITMRDIIPKEIPSGASVNKYTIDFQDFSEMVSDIQTGNFTEREFNKLKDLLTYWYQRAVVVTVDLDNLLQPVYPEDYELINIYWSGAEDYDVILWNEGDSSGVCVIFGNNDIDYDRQFRWMSLEEDIKQAEGSTCLFTVEYEDDKNATVVKRYHEGPYNYEENAYRPGDLISINRHYSFTQDNTKYYVKEHYYGKEEILSYIKLFVVKGDQWGYFNIEDPSELPSIEYLSQFGFEPYKG